MSKTDCQQMLIHFEATYPQAPITGQRAHQYGAWMMDEGRGHVGLKTSKRATCVEVMDLWVAPNLRQEGVGRKIMNEVCRVADVMGITLKLRVLAYHRRDNGCSNGQLRKFYESFGFEKVDGQYYYRAPRHT